jgi:hypothetical protein
MWPSGCTDWTVSVVGAIQDADHELLVVRHRRAYRSRPARQEGARALAAGEDSRLCADSRPGWTDCRQAERADIHLVLAAIEDVLVPAFLVEDCDEDHCAIFVPSVPTPAAGSIDIIAKARVHPVDVPFTQAVGVISKWGPGSGELLAGMTRAARPAVPVRTWPEAATSSLDGKTRAGSGRRIGT